MQSVNPVNDDETYFQYTGTVTLNHKETGKHSQRLLKTKFFVSKRNWKGINYLSGKGSEKIEKNNPKIAGNVLYVKEINIYPPYISQLKS